MGTDFDLDGGLIARCVTAGEGKRQDYETCTMVAQPVAFSSKDYGADAGEIAPTLRAMGHAGSHANGGGQVAVAVTGDVFHTLRGEGFDASEDGTGRGTPLAPVAYGIRTANTSSNGWGIQEEVTHTLDTAQGVAVAVALRGREGGATAELGDEVQNCLRASSGGGDKPHVLADMMVRRLTCEEAEFLQGFPRGYTAIPWRKKPESECPDGPRYKALGNSWAVPVARWIGKRIEQLRRG